MATATVHTTPAPGQTSEEVTSALSHATRVSPATVSLSLSLSLSLTLSFLAFNTSYKECTVDIIYNVVYFVYCFARSFS